MSKHTQEPWLRDTNSGLNCDVRAESGRKVALCWGLSTSKSARLNTKTYRDECDANASRIVACVNACAGMGDPESEIAALRKQRDELLTALQGMIDIASDSHGVAGYHLNGEVAGWGEFEEVKAACDAIAKAKGGAS